MNIEIGITSCPEFEVPEHVNIAFNSALIKRLYLPAEYAEECYPEILKAPVGD